MMWWASPLFQLAENDALLVRLLLNVAANDLLFVKTINVSID